MIQIDGTKRHVYLKFINDTYVQNILQTTNGIAEYKHVTGEIYTVYLEPARVSIRRVKIVNVPPETPERTIRTTLAAYGTIIKIQDEYWSKAYRFKVPNGIKGVVMKISKHLPSKMQIAGHIVLITYEGQPSTCYGCGQTGHVYQTCLTRRPRDTTTESKPASTWAQIAANVTPHQTVTDNDPIDAGPSEVSHTKESTRSSWYEESMDTHEPQTQSEDKIEPIDKELSTPMARADVTAETTPATQPTAENEIQTDDMKSNPTHEEPNQGRSKPPTAKQSRQECAVSTENLARRDITENDEARGVPT
jgi:hypothetical protein